MTRPRKLQPKAWVVNMDESSVECQMAHLTAKIVTEKGKAYGDPTLTQSTAVMEALYPDGIAPHQLADSLVVVRIVDKLCRITLGDPLTDREDPWRDINGYSLRKMVARSFEDAND